jgi:hypothetical protein
VVTWKRGAALLAVLALATAAVLSVSVLDAPQASAQTLTTVLPTSGNQICLGSVPCVNFPTGLGSAGGLHDNASSTFQPFFEDFFNEFFTLFTANMSLLMVWLGASLLLFVLGSVADKWISNHRKDIAILRSYDNL